MQNIDFKMLEAGMKYCVLNAKMAPLHRLFILNGLPRIITKIYDGTRIPCEVKRDLENSWWLRKGIERTLYNH